MAPKTWAAAAGSANYAAQKAKAKPKAKAAPGTAGVVAAASAIDGALRSTPLGWTHEVDAGLAAEQRPVLTTDAIGAFCAFGLALPTTSARTSVYRDDLIGPAQPPTIKPNLRSAVFTHDTMVYSFSCGVAVNTVVTGNWVLRHAWMLCIRMLAIPPTLRQTMPCLLHASELSHRLVRRRKGRDGPRAIVGFADSMEARFGKAWAPAQVTKAGIFVAQRFFTGAANVQLTGSLAGQAGRIVLGSLGDKQDHGIFVAGSRAVPAADALNNSVVFSGPEATAVGTLHGNCGSDVLVEVLEVVGPVERRAQPAYNTKGRLPQPGPMDISWRCFKIISACLATDWSLCLWPPNSSG